jgi:hypothetical protein
VGGRRDAFGPRGVSRDRLRRRGVAGLARDADGVRRAGGDHRSSRSWGRRKRWRAAGRRRRGKLAVLGRPRGSSPLVVRRRRGGECVVPRWGAFLRWRRCTRQTGGRSGGGSALREQRRLHSADLDVLRKVFLRRSGRRMRRAPGGLRPYAGQRGAACLRLRWGELLERLLAKGGRRRVPHPGRVHLPVRGVRWGSPTAYHVSGP